MKSLDIHHPEYKSERHSAYHLYIELDEHSARALVIDPIDMIYLRLISLDSSNISSFVKTLGDSNFKSVLVAAQNPFASLIPRDYFDEKNLQTYLSVLNGREFESNALRWDSLNEPEANVCYAIEAPIVEEIEASFPNVSIGHHLTFMTFLASTEVKDSHSSHIFLNVRENTIEILAFNESSLKYQNHFRTIGEQDILYHCLNVSDLLGFSNDQLILHISGKVSDAMKLKLKKYIPHLNFRAIDPRLSFPEKLDDKMKLEFHSLLQLHLCE